MNTQTHDIRNDPDVRTVQWYDTQAEVMRVLAGMQLSGWWVSTNGLMTTSGGGSLVARPLKIKGEDQFTGIGIWQINPSTEA